MSDGAWSNQLANLIVLNAAVHGYSGFFVYSPTPGPGNLVGSWTAAAGTDPYGNAYPAGLSVTDFNFEGSDFIINTAGAFFYEGTPATGNLFVSITTANGTDSFGNAYLSGVEVHGTTTSFATPALVQHVGNSATNVSTLATTIAATGTGNTLIVCVGHSVNDEPVSSVLLSGSADNFRQDFFVNVLNPNIETWSDPGAASGHTTVTVNLAGNDDLSVDVYEFSGLLTPTPLDKTSGNQLFSTGPTWTSNATAATSQAAEVLIGMVGGFNNAGSNPTLTGPAAPWVNETPHFPGSATFMMSGYQVVAATGAYAYAGTSNMTNPNNFYSASIVTYKAAGGGTVETGANINLTTFGGVPAAFWATGAAEETVAANIEAIVGNAGASEILVWSLTSPRIATFTSFVYIQMSSPAKDGSADTVGTLVYDALITQHNLLEWGPNGAQVGSVGASPNFLQQISGAQPAEVAQHNFSTLAFQTITQAWSIPAGDAKVGTVYRLTVRGNGTMSNPASAFAMQGLVGGVGAAEATIPAAIVAANAVFGFKAVLEITVYTTGSGGTAGVSLDIRAGGANVTAQSAYGESITIAFNTTVSNSVQLEALWVTTAGVGANRDNTFEKIGGQ